MRLNQILTVRNMSKPFNEMRVPPASQRSDGLGLERELRLVSENPIIDSILESVYGLLAVLNEHRQILAVNNALLAMLGIADAEELLGLRPGEAVQCVYAHEEETGCGTSKFCSTCGAAIAIVTALGTDGPAERECAIAAEKDGKRFDLYLHVRCCPITVEGHRFLLLFLRDISAEQQRAALERIFYHDISNVIENLLADSRLLTSAGTEDDVRRLADHIHDLAVRLVKEVRIQKALSRGPEDRDVGLRDVPVERVLRNVAAAVRNHSAAYGKTLLLPDPCPDVSVATDGYLAERVLTNMVVNALEATDIGSQVKLWVEDARKAVTFCVWNQEAMPEEVARRVFQRNFTTKPGDGRGLGTFAMKLIGETYLQGKVDFTSSRRDGTIFRFYIPK
jgi:signal transduction histidine kinase